MKRKLLALAVVAGFVAMGAQADISVTINSNNMVNGYMNVFELDGTTFAFGSPWGVGDLSASYNGSTEVTLTPNTIGDPDPYWYIGGGGPGAAGNKIMEANLYAEDTGTLNGETVVFEGTVLSDTLTSAHNVYAFVRDFAPDYSSSVDSFIPVSGAGGFSVSLATINDPGRHVQYGLQMKGVNVWATDVGPYGGMTIEAIPEPATIGLLAIFGGGLIAFRRRFRM